MKTNTFSKLQIAKAILVGMLTLEAFTHGAQAAPTAGAVAPPAVAADPQQLKNVETRLGVKVDSIIRLPVAGLYEVKVGNDIGYTDAKGDYFLMGNLIDLRSRANLTKERVDSLAEAALPKVQLSDLPLDSAIKIVRGNGKRVLVAFEDPNCGFCKRLEKSFDDVHDVTLYVFLYPILGDDSVKKSKDIWCAADRGKVWNGWMQSATPIAAGPDCANPLDRNVELGQKLKIDGTPTMFFANGKRVAGAIPAEQVNKLLSAASPS